MDIQEYRNWRPTYSVYELQYPIEAGYGNDQLNCFLGCTGLVSEASELMSVVHKAYRKGTKVDFLKAKDEASDVWWYFNKILDDFGWTLEELSQYNKEKLDSRNKEVIAL